MNVKGITTCMSYQQLDDVSSATGLTVPLRTPDGMSVKANFALIVAETQNARWRDDGVNPTASVGVYHPSQASWSVSLHGSITLLTPTEAIAGASALLSMPYWTLGPITLRKVNYLSIL